MIIVSSYKYRLLCRDLGPMSNAGMVPTSHLSFFSSSCLFSLFSSSVTFSCLSFLLLIGTYIPKKEVMVEETIRATVIKPNQAIKLRARKETTVSKPTQCMGRGNGRGRTLSVRSYHHFMHCLPLTRRIATAILASLERNGW